MVTEGSVAKQPTAEQTKEAVLKPCCTAKFVVAYTCVYIWSIASSKHINRGVIGERMKIDFLQRWVLHTVQEFYISSSDLAGRAE